VALDALHTEFHEDAMALDMLRRALEEPARQIAQNAGADGAIAIDTIRRRQCDGANRMIGFDALREEYGDLVEWGIIDPAKVVRAALENAVSVAGMILSTDALIAELPEPKQNGAAVALEMAY
jgi:chaperonin GroEL